MCNIVGCCCLQLGLNKFLISSGSRFSVNDKYLYLKIFFPCTKNCSNSHFLVKISVHTIVFLYLYSNLILNFMEKYSSYHSAFSKIIGALRRMQRWQSKRAFWAKKILQLFLLELPLSRKYCFYPRSNVNSGTVETAQGLL